MSKITLSSLSNLQNETTAVGVINNNSAVITTAFDNTLSRDGTSPNQMGAALDMNSNQIINLPAPSTTSSPARLIDVVSNPTIVVPGTGTSGHVVPFLDGNNTWSGTNIIPGVLSNIRLAKTANYTVLNADKGSTIALGGSSFYTLTFTAATNYDVNFTVMVVNEDTGRGKTLTIPGITTRLLQPGEVAVIFNQNNVWQIFRETRWKVPAGTLTLNTDFTNGNDSNDGYSTGSGNALKTVEGALVRIANDYDLNSTTTPTTVVIKMAAGSTDTQGVHVSLHAFVGADGGASVKIDGNGATISTTTSCLQFYFGTVVQLRNITLISSAGNGLDISWGSKVYLLDLVTFGGGVADINLQGGGQIELENNYTISGTRSYHILNSNGILRTGVPVTASLSNNMTVTNWILGIYSGLSDLSNITWNLNAHTVTATNAYNISQYHSAAGLGTVPGSGAGVYTLDNVTIGNTTQGGGSFTNLKALATTAIPAGGTTGVGILASSTANFGLFFGSGLPALSAAQGSIYLRSDGSSTSTRMYINTNGSTTWTNVTTAA